MSLVGVRPLNLPGISDADYIELVDFTGRELHPGKRGMIAASEPRALVWFLTPQCPRIRLGLLAQEWAYYLRAYRQDETR